jgi:hypothetical protein
MQKLITFKWINQFWQTRSKNTVWLHFNDFILKINNVHIKSFFQEYYKTKTDVRIFVYNDGLFWYLLIKKGCIVQSLLSVNIS